MRSKCMYRGCTEGTGRTYIYVLGTQGRILRVNCGNSLSLFGTLAYNDLKSSVAKMKPLKPAKY